MPEAVEALRALSQFLNKKPLYRAQMYEIFIEFLDSIYWSGYAEELANSNPEAYNFELNQFFNNY